MNNKIKGLLGLAQRARKIVIGETAMTAIRQKKAKLVVLSSDCSPRTIKQVSDKCKTYEVEIIRVESSEELSQSIGKNNIVFLAVLDEGFANALKKNN